MSYELNFVENNRPKHSNIFWIKCGCLEENDWHSVRLFIKNYIIDLDTIMFEVKATLSTSYLDRLLTLLHYLANDI